MTEDEKMIAALGGASALAALLGYADGGVQRVCNWKTRGIPARVRLDNAALFRRAQKIAVKVAQNDHA